MNLTLSILVPSLPSRLSRLTRLLGKVLGQADMFDDVEVCVWMDNKKRSIGRKRDDLVQMARGNFLAFVDDDDDVSDDYVSELRTAALEHPNVDVIVFNQRVLMGSAKPFVIRFGIEFENQAAAEHGGRDITRKPFHVCAWRTELAQTARFPDISYGEDWEWVKQLLPKVKQQARVDQILHTYRYDVNVTEAPTELSL